MTSVSGHPLWWGLSLYSVGGQAELYLYAHCTLIACTPPPFLDIANIKCSP